MAVCVKVKQAVKVVKKRVVYGVKCSMPNSKQSSEKARLWFAAFRVLKLIVYFDYLLTSFPDWISASAFSVVQDLVFILFENSSLE